MLHQLEQIDVNSLSSEDIDNLLPMLESALIEAQKVPVSVAAKNSFEEEWQYVQDELTELFNNSLLQDKKLMQLEFLMRAIIGKYMDEEDCNSFFVIFELCEEEKNFRKSLSFINNYPHSLAASLCFAVYRLNKKAIIDQKIPFYGKRGDLMRTVKSAVNSDCEVVKSFIKEFTSTIPDYSSEPLISL
jgi:hypothetical protein